MTCTIAMKTLIDTFPSAIFSQILQKGDGAVQFKRNTKSEQNFDRNWRQLLVSDIPKRAFRGVWKILATVATFVLNIKLFLVNLLHGYYVTTINWLSKVHCGNTMGIPVPIYAKALSVIKPCNLPMLSFVRICAQKHQPLTDIKTKMRK